MVGPSFQFYFLVLSEKTKAKAAEARIKKLSKAYVYVLHYQKNKYSICIIHRFILGWIMVKISKNRSTRVKKADKLTNLFFYKNISKTFNAHLMRKSGLFSIHLLLDFSLQKKKRQILGFFDLVPTNKFSLSLFEKRKKNLNKNVNEYRNQSKLTFRKLN